MLLQADQGPPQFAQAGPLVAGCLSEVRYPAKVSIVQAANDDRNLVNPGAYSGPWRDSPYDMRFAERAMDGLLASSSWSVVAIMGPAQTGKSEVGNNWQLHTVIYDPADMMFVMPDRISIEQYVKTQWDKMVTACPKLEGRLLDGASADTINLKQFKGCSFFFLWPTGPTFRAKPVSRGRLDDYDDIPQNIGVQAGGVGGQGDPLSQMLGRGGSFSAYGGSKVYVNSTPKLGKKRGIEQIVASGTDERWYVDCLACGEPFILDTEDRLKFNRTPFADDAAASAEVVCADPECGGLHRQQDKGALMATGRWVGRGETAVNRSIDPVGKVGELVATDRLTQRWDGLMGFRRWGEIAKMWREAELAFENEQDEGPLTTFFQTVIGKNYTPQASGEPRVSEDDLEKRARASAHRFGVVPRDAYCVVMSVDQAINRFEVAAWAFGRGFKAWLIDRFSIVNCGDEPLRPFTRSEHFAVLHPRVLSKRYPVEGDATRTVKPLCTVLDIGGMDDATDNAFAWWHSMVVGDVGSGRMPVPPTAITLFKGGNKADGKLLPPPTVDAKRQLPGHPTCEFFVPNVHRIKNMADVGLRRADGGSGSIVFPGDQDEHGELKAAKYISEMTAETLENEVWVRPPNTPNETLDLYVMARTALIRFGGGDHSLSWVPSWARPPRSVVLPNPEHEASAQEESAHREAMADAADREDLSHERHPPLQRQPSSQQFRRPRVKVRRAR